MIQFSICLLLGPWEITFPVDGLNDMTAAGFRERVAAHFKTLKDADGRPLLLRVKTEGDLATIAADCPVGEIALADIRKALDGSDYAGPDALRVFPEGGSGPGAVPVI